MTWKPQSHTLQWPIVIEGAAAITVVEMKAFTVGEHRAALATVGNDEDEQFEALLLVATGLEPKVLEQMKRPDYVSISKQLFEYVRKPAGEFMEAAPADPDDVPLLVPFQGVGRMIERMTLEVPAMKATKVMRKLKTAEERADFISSACTGLSTPELMRMSVPDWNQLQERVGDFLNKPADYFRSVTSK
ncbi:phage tail assembly protein [Pseudomonas alloputida]|uniref:phage tail assembly protein n=1 Tax=Pseudomonas alloputida TaxID=1940621 RepID=UPI001E3E2D9F|nr:phage tail assembly protein [Pseudomonas alloputida]